MRMTNEDVRESFSEYILSANLMALIFLQNVNVILL